MINIIINTKFSAIHCWPKCPIESVAYLRNPHRHEFHVQAKKEVFGDDRDIEFINLKNDVEKYIRIRWDKKDIGSTSCEQMAEQLAEAYDFNYVRIMEDGENGAEYIKEKI